MSYFQKLAESWFQNHFLITLTPRKKSGGFFCQKGFLYSSELWIISFLV
jgi:hypothetical protein